MEVKVFPLETLRQFSTRVFRHFGIPEASCRCTGLRRLARHRFAWRSSAAHPL
jgi:hypothetical protein